MPKKASTPVKRGPKPDLLKIDGNWEAAVTEVPGEEKTSDRMAEREVA
jgi:hypothetical protein